MTHLRTYKELKKFDRENIVKLNLDQIEEEKDGEQLSSYRDNSLAQSSRNKNSGSERKGESSQENEIKEESSQYSELSEEKNF